MAVKFTRNTKNVMLFPNTGKGTVDKILKRETPKD